ncbi:reverse transcriptase domain-containing protein [Tanacetum coccineum]|uniref:Reverse transcriptase domain-containing protein n=1 Tax=Tanacetum coccineum TaxID=301880 RepID=A0ABQ4ZE56_9ASTR
MTIVKNEKTSSSRKGQSRDGAARRLRLLECDSHDPSTITYSNLEKMLKSDARRPTLCKLGKVVPGLEHGLRGSYVLAQKCLSAELEFDIEIRDKKGVENLTADHLSRLENPNLGKLTKAEIRDLFPEERLMAVSDKNNEPRNEPRFYSSNVLTESYKGASLEMRQHKSFSNVTADHLEDIMGIDFMGPFPSSNGNKYILVAIDYMSKWVEAQHFPTSDSRNVVNFLKRLFALFGIPKALISDRATHFCNYQMEKAMKRLYLMRRSLEVLRKLHWTIIGGRFNQLSHVSSLLLSNPGEYYREYVLAHLKLVFEFSIYKVWKSVGYRVSMYWIRRIHVLDTAYPCIGYGLLGISWSRHGYAVSSLMDTAYWSSEQPTTLGESFSLARIVEARYEDERSTIAIAKPNDLTARVTDQPYQGVGGSPEEASWEWMSDSHMPWAADIGRRKRVKCYIQESKRLKRKKVVDCGSGRRDCALFGASILALLNPGPGSFAHRRIWDSGIKTFFRHHLEDKVVFEGVGSDTPIVRITIILSVVILGKCHKVNIYPVVKVKGQSVINGKRGAMYSPVSKEMKMSKKIKKKKKEEGRRRRRKKKKQEIEEEARDRRRKKMKEEKQREERKKLRSSPAPQTKT